MVGEKHRIGGVQFRAVGTRAKVARGPLLVRGIARLQNVGEAMVRKELEELARLARKKGIPKEIGEKVREIKSLRAKRNFLMQYYLRQEARLTARDKEFPRLLNREFFFHKLGKTLKYGGYHSLAYLDIDGLREINTKFGRKEGGLAFLTAFSKSLSEVVPKVKGFSGHIGGDEFVVYLPLPPQAAKALLAAEFEKVRQSELRKWPKFKQAKESGIGMNFSAGIVGLAKNSPVDVAETVADRLCYEAKAQGRDRVTFAVKKGI